MLLMYIYVCENIYVDLLQSFLFVVWYNYITVVYSYRKGVRNIVIHNNISSFI